MDLYNQNGAISRAIKDHTPEILIVSLAIVAYAVSLINTFHTDDWAVLSLLRDGLSWRDLLSMDDMRRFRPLTNIIIYLRYLAFGGSPIGYYALNIVLHAFFGILFYRFLNRLGLKTAVSLLSAIIFTAYFQHYEAVLWLYGIIRILAAIFWVGALWTLYNYFVTGKRAALIQFAAISFLGYFVAEEFAVSPLGYLLFAVLIPKAGKEGGNPEFKKPYLGRIKLPMIISLIGLAIYFILRSTLIVQPSLAEGYYYPDLHMFSRLLAYLQWMILPPPDHPYFIRLTTALNPAIISAWKTLSIGLVVLLGLDFIYAQFRSSGLIKFMVIFILLTLLPAMPLIYKVTSRYIYIPSIGLSVLFGILFYGIYQRIKARIWGRGLAYAFLSGYLIVNILAVWVTSFEYHRNQTLVASLLDDLRDSGIDFNHYQYVVLDHLPGRTIVGPAMTYEMGYSHEVVASNDPSVPGPVDIKAAVRDISLRNVPFVVFDYKNGHLRESTADYIKYGAENQPILDN